jgi:hypothetical protein
MSTANQTPRNRSRHWAKPMTAHHPSTMRARLGGVYNGVMTIPETLCHQDFGLGVLNHRNGEHVILDGNDDLVTTNVSARILD